MKTAGTQRFRARKIDLKKPLQIYIASELDDLDKEDINRTVDIETGVEKEEEAEHHLQAAISAVQAVITGRTVNTENNYGSESNQGADSSQNKAPSAYIPTPETRKVEDLKIRWYGKRNPISKDRVRSILTVEDVCGPMYCMDEDDESWLNEYNSEIEVEIQKIKDNLVDFELENGQPIDADVEIQRLNELKEKLLSEDRFETLMDQLETVTMDMIFTKDSDIPSLSQLFDHALNSALELEEDSSIVFDYWKKKRGLFNFENIMPRLVTVDPPKNSNPYVCFRKREVKQIRKTRRADIKAVEQLQKIQLNLVCAAQILESVVNRESTKRDLLLLSKKSTEQRSLVLALRRHYGLPLGNVSELFSIPAPAISSTTRKRLSLTGDITNSSNSSMISTPSESYTNLSNQFNKNNHHGPGGHKGFYSVIDESEDGFLDAGEYRYYNTPTKGFSASHEFPGRQLDSNKKNFAFGGAGHGFTLDKNGLPIRVDVPVYTTSKRVRDIHERIRNRTKRKLELMRTFVDGSYIPMKNKIIGEKAFSISKADTLNEADSIKNSKRSYFEFKSAANLNVFNKEALASFRDTEILKSDNDDIMFRLRHGRHNNEVYLDQKLVHGKSKGKIRRISNKPNYAQSIDQADQNLDQMLFRYSLLEKQDYEALRNIATTFPNFPFSKSQNIPCSIESSNENKANPVSETDKDNESSDTNILENNHKTLENNEPLINLVKSRKKFGFRHQAGTHVWKNSSEYNKIIESHCESLGYKASQEQDSSGKVMEMLTLFNNMEINSIMEQAEFVTMVNVAFPQPAVARAEVKINSVIGQIPGSVIESSGGSVPGTLAINMALNQQQQTISPLASRGIGSGIGAQKPIDNLSVLQANQSNFAALGNAVNYGSGIVGNSGANAALMALNGHQSQINNNSALYKSQLQFLQAQAQLQQQKAQQMQAASQLSQQQLKIKFAVQHQMQQLNQQQIQLQFQLHTQAQLDRQKQAQIQQLQVQIKSLIQPQKVPVQSVMNVDNNNQPSNTNELPAENENGDQENTTANNVNMSQDNQTSDSAANSGDNNSLPITNGNGPEKFNSNTSTPVHLPTQIDGNQNISDLELEKPKNENSNSEQKKDETNSSRHNLEYDRKLLNTKNEFIEQESSDSETDTDTDMVKSIITASGNTNDAEMSSPNITAAAQPKTAMILESKSNM
ncbi:hypothetical protein BB558_001753 [Smittium angustum]|uniref:Enhancer of polycomb-like protein n=1 Tax=Smittium angustum TaxID=133377 RepID=A0A2U1JAS2_SMIAN|nr:hypothetical protein BB558_001753 [Smittium angustum]